MMEVTVYGFEALTKALTENNGQRKFVLFTGSKDKDGVSWCPDCNDGKTSSIIFLTLLRF